MPGRKAHAMMQLNGSYEQQSSTCEEIQLSWQEQVTKVFRTRAFRKPLSAKPAEKKVRRCQPAMLDYTGK
jgi:hypothetical protein